MIVSEPSVEAPAFSQRPLHQQTHHGPTKSSASSYPRPVQRLAATGRAKYVPDAAVTDGVQREATGTPSVTPRRWSRPVIPAQGPFLQCGGSRIRTLEGISRRIYSPLPFGRTAPGYRRHQPCPPRALHGEHQRSFTANGGQPKPQLSGSILPTSRCFQGHDQKLCLRQTSAPGWPRAAPESGGSPAARVSRRVGGRSVGGPGAGVHVVQPSGAPHGPLPLARFKARSPTRRDTRFPHVLRQLHTSYAR